MIVDQFLFGFLPGFFCRFAYSWPILVIGELGAIAFKSAFAGAFPGAYVQHKFPNRMSCRNWMRTRLDRTDAVQYWQHSWPMPGLTFKSTPKLINNSFDFRQDSS